MYRARDLENDSPVAIKRLVGPGGDARWEIETRLLAELSHPGLTTLVDHFEEPAGIYNIVMSLVDGTDLARLLWDEGTPGLPARDVLHWIGQVCEALQYMHDQQIVHGDVKPRNLVRGPERVVVVDLGVASRLEGESATARGGTPRYMAPEVFAGEAASPRSDVFGVSASAWDLITGSPPAYGEDRSLEAIPGVTPELEHVLRGGLAFRPEDRIESVAALADASRAPMDASAGASLAVSIERRAQAAAAGGRRPRRCRGIRGGGVSIALAEPGAGHLTYVAAWGAGANEQTVGLDLLMGRASAVRGRDRQGADRSALPH